MEKKLLPTLKEWNFSNCISAIDGKHVTMQAPPKSGSEFLTYKKAFSILLIAACDAQYKFAYVNVGSAAHWSDGGTFDI